MAFVCTLGSDLPDIAEFLEREFPFITAPVGYDDEEGCSYSVIVGLQAGGGVAEFYFHIQKFHDDTAEIESIQSGLELTKAISKADRTRILETILLLTDLLLSRAGAREIYRCTMDIDPPPKALAKLRRFRRSPRGRA